MDYQHVRMSPPVPVRLELDPTYATMARAGQVYVYTSLHGRGDMTHEIASLTSGVLR